MPIDKNLDRLMRPFQHEGRPVPVPVYVHTALVDGVSGDGTTGPSLGPFEYVEVVMDTVRVDEGETLAYYDHGSGLWSLSAKAGDDAGQRYSDLTISTTEPQEN